MQKCLLKCLFFLVNSIVCLMKRCRYNAAFSKSHECICYCSSLVLFFVFSGAARHRRTWTARPLSALPWTTSNVLDPESSWEKMCSASSEPYACLTQKTELLLFICLMLDFFGIKTENTKMFPLFYFGSLITSFLLHKYRESIHIIVIIYSMHC